MSIPYLAQAADHEQLEWLGGGVMRILLDGKKTGGQLTMLRSAAAGGSASPVHVHAGEDEIVVLLQGSGIFWAGEHRSELSEGGVAFLPRNIPHAYRFTSQAVDMLARRAAPNSRGRGRRKGPSWHALENAESNSNVQIVNLGYRG
jgi:quercetin dioxygenase-like cupin family protein